RRDLPAPRGGLGGYSRASPRAPAAPWPRRSRAPGREARDAGGDPEAGRRAGLAAFPPARAPPAGASRGGRFAAGSGGGAGGAGGAGSAGSSGGRRRRGGPRDAPPPARARPRRAAAAGLVGSSRRAMNFEISEEHARIRDAVREFAEEEIAPGAAEREREERFPREVLAGLAEMGVLGMMVPEQYGGAGAGADALSLVLALEELSRVCASTAVIVSVNNSVFCYPLWKFGSEEQKKTILTEVASGRVLGAYALTEPQSGSDAANQKTRAVRDGDSYVLTGEKVWITNAGEAAWYLVMAMTDPAAGTRGITAFLVSAEDPGFRVGANEPKMGL